VTFVYDEARSYLAREKERFDIVVVTFIDTFAPPLPARTP